MHCKVVRTQIKDGKRKDGTPYIGAATTVIFPDGCTGAQLFIGEEVCDPTSIILGGIYDLYRDEKGYAIYFEHVEENGNK